MRNDCGSGWKKCGNAAQQGLRVSNAAIGLLLGALVLSPMSAIADPDEPEDLADTLIEDLAGGHYSILGDVDIVGETVEPDDPRIAEFWSDGFGGPSIANKASVKQVGQYNYAHVEQSGMQNYAGVHQWGGSNSANLTQGGYGNGLTLVQYGNGLRVSVGQKGVGRSATVIQTN